MKAASRSPTVKRQGLGVWDLPKLLGSVHRYRKSRPKVRPERPHFRAILAFVHRNRFAISSQIQRRFPKYLRSDRTARRHLAEMESLGLLSVVGTNNVSPLWPKVYFVTRRGLTRLRQALHDQGQEWSESLRDRRRSDGSSAQHVLHELFVTEFLLLAWEAAEHREDLQILSMQRRSLAKHESFKVVIAGKRTRLEPDGMFLSRQQGKGMMCCFVELDLDSMTPRQMAVKFRRYQVWSESQTAMTYLKNLYERHGATFPTAAFRILLVVGSKNRQAERRRVASLLDVAKQLPPAVQNRIWLTTVQQLQSAGSSKVLTEPLWLRPRDVRDDKGVSLDSRLSLHALFA
ncbi:MAG: replication-relaxation family protein [Planctomycetaceae bacterium]|nr:replication-relaxation family protein [Planctomycetaceae bacterium]